MESDVTFTIATVILVIMIVYSSYTVYLSVHNFNKCLTYEHGGCPILNCGDSSISKNNPEPKYKSDPKCGYGAFRIDGGEKICSGQIN